MQESNAVFERIAEECIKFMSEFDKISLTTRDRRQADASGITVSLKQSR